MSRISGCQPSLVIAPLKYHGHSVVYRLHQLIRVCREDGERSQLLSCRSVLPYFPEASECEHRVVLDFNREWLFVLLIDLVPLIEQIGRNKTTPLLPCFAEGRARSNSLGLGVDGAERCLSVLRPEGNESPPHDAQFTFACLRVQTHNWLQALRSN